MRRQRCSATVGEELVRLGARFIAPVPVEDLLDDQRRVLIVGDGVATVPYMNT
jgi:hypothetical protein